MNRYPHGGWKGNTNGKRTSRDKGEKFPNGRPPSENRKNVATRPRPDMRSEGCSGNGESKESQTKLKSQEKKGWRQSRPAGAGKSGGKSNTAIVDKWSKPEKGKYCGNKTRREE